VAWPLPNPDPGSVGLLVADRHPHTWEVAEAVRLALDRRMPGVRTIALISESQWRQRLLDSRPIGVVGFFNETDLARLEPLGLPMVNIASAMRHRLPSVVPDHRAVGAMAARHLIGRGYGEIAVIMYQVESFARERYEGCRAEAEAHGVKAWFEPWDGNEGPWLDRLSESVKHQRVGLFAGGDFGARRMSEVLLAHGLAVPEQVALLGTNNSVRLCELCSPPLTSVDIDPQRMGLACVGMLLQMLANQPLASRTVLVQPRGVVERASTDAIAYADPEVRRAVEYIQRRGGVPMRVDEVMEGARVSRRTLEMRFRKQVGRTIRQEIERHRFAEACRLLADSDLPIGTIAGRCGFSEHARFSSAFRNAIGQTPTAYRRASRPLGWSDA